MEKEKFDIDQLIANRLLGTISDEENLFLDDWIKQSIENQRLYSEQKRLWNLFEIHQKVQKIDERKAYQTISDQLFIKKKVNVFGWIQRIAAILLLPVIIASVYYFYLGKGNHNQFSTVYNTVETPLGMRSSLTLPDGTQVWLNAGSSISYPVLFADNYRKVSLSGEAYFEVKKNKKWPFIVSAKNMDIIVSGTTFNCNAYPENNQIQTVLVEGAISLTNNSATVNVLMTPGELATFNSSDQKVTKIKTDLQKYVAWKSGKLMFRDDKMNKVVEKLERWYNVEFDIEDKEIEDYIYTATFVDESLDQVLKMLSISAPIRYTISERNKQEDQTFAKSKVKLYKR
ncbi:anti-sigma factor [Aquipluma nitroreducens]|uniref:Anti-sigma factor n=1 Tax=Aquipluma nitroreducens TaxID=2010828 RepID=A0A5K7S969_9BACT|nr:FecR domain-containing protein [Aquipluma nitroreducens]BBE18111.1 anti-sigma factor [Aquipluma nitroreducens]